MSGGDAIHGLVGEFRTPDDAVAAARELGDAGLTRWDLYGPSPLEEVVRAVPSRRGLAITIVMFFAGLAGACWGYFIQYWGAVLDYPINVGGRPYNGWPGFVPSAWEICALFTVCIGFLAFLVASRLPRLSHPLFSAPRFDRATQDRFFICVEAADERYEAARVREIFGRHGVVEASEVRE